MEHVQEMQRLLDEVRQCLADALQSDIDHAAEVARLMEVSAVEHHDFKEALASRDLIGQAKGVLMALLGCSPEHAFGLLVTQSQHENRKVSDIAAAITARTRRDNAAG
jgi:AmiR/NasT family two-component response regulator